MTSSDVIAEHDIVAERSMMSFGSDKGYIRRHLSPSNPSFSFHSLQSSRPLESSQPLDLIMPSQVAQGQIDRAHYVRAQQLLSPRFDFTMDMSSEDENMAFDQRADASNASLDHASIVCNTTAIVALDKAILPLESTLKDLRATRSILLEPLSKLNNSNDHSNNSDDHSTDSDSHSSNSDSDASSVFNLGGPLARSA